MLLRLAGAALLAAGACAAGPAAVSLTIGTQPFRNASALFGAFLEDINHSVEGGLASQLISDPQTRTLGDLSVSLSSPDGSQWLRHCCYVAYASSPPFGGGGNSDATFLWQTPLDGSSGSISLQLTNFPGYYLIAEGSGVHAVPQPAGANATFASAASWVVTENAGGTVALKNRATGGVLQRTQACSPGSCCSFIGTCSGIAVAAGSTSDAGAQWSVGSGLASASVEAWSVSPPAAGGALVSASIVNASTALLLNANQTTALSLVITSAGNGSASGAGEALAPMPPFMRAPARRARSGLPKASALSAGGACNGGYWGMAIQQGSVYLARFFASSPKAAVASAPLASLALTLESADGSTVLGAAVLAPPVPGAGWSAFTANITAIASAPGGNARFCIRAAPPASASAGTAAQLLLSSVMLWPADTWQGRPFGARRDLSQLIADMQPPYMRFPGGCYIMGLTLADAYNFTRTIGPMETRAGHPNWWGYWSTDVFGFFEYLQWIEDIGAKPIWVLSVGATQGNEWTPTGPALQPYVDNAVASLSFAMGDPATDYYAAIRAAMGRPEPFDIPIVAIGNENCYSYAFDPAYPAAFQQIANAIKAAFPAVQTVANCDIRATSGFQPAPADLHYDFFDYHVYSNPSWFIDNQYMWDDYPRGASSPRVFASEYAVTSECGEGNLLAALSEAAWMVGLERNSDVVPIASYAPLLVNANDRAWNPDAVVFNASVAYGTPSYWAQRLFSSNARAGAALLPFNLSTTDSALVTPPVPYGAGLPLANVVANTSVSVTADAAGDLVVKLVNYGPSSLMLSVGLQGSSGASLPPFALLSTITSPTGDVTQENSFEQPEAVAVAESLVPAGPGSPVAIPAFSINVLRFSSAGRR